MSELTWHLFLKCCIKSLNKLNQSQILLWKFSTVPCLKNMTANRFNIEAWQYVQLDKKPQGKCCIDCQAILVI